jgi:serine/threonine protein kinase
MSVTSGTRLGPYEIVAPLGSGGMGEVYRARDTKLRREVALKVLPDTFAADPERLVRFTREARVLATLNHPNIAAIYGVEDSGAVHALVLELVEGPTLADRIAAGPIPIAEAAQIASQITEALEAAHEKGIVHRDLKPANVKVTPDDRVKVLDFRAGQGAGGRTCGRRIDAANDDGDGQPARGHRGDRRVHEPGAGAGQAG